MHHRLLWPYWRPIFASLLLDDASPHLKCPLSIRYSLGLHPAGLSAPADTIHADSPTGLLPAADAAWRQSCPDDPISAYDTWFTNNTYHATIPSHRATQVLGFNLTETLASHFYRAERPSHKAMTAFVHSNLNPCDIVHYPSVMMPCLLHCHPHLLPEGTPPQ